MDIEKIKASVEYEIFVRQDDTPVRGNAMASGDEDYDREIEDEIINRLDNGDVWAWATIEVRATVPGIPGVSGSDYLGNCTYANQAEFEKPGCYYDDMKAVALVSLLESIEEMEDALSTFA